MAHIRVELGSEWKCETAYWPAHRPVLAEVAIGPLRIKRMLSASEAERIVERQRARQFAESQRSRAA